MGQADRQRVSGSNRHVVSEVMRESTSLVLVQTNKWV